MGKNRIKDDKLLNIPLAQNVFDSASSIIAVKPVAKYLSGARCIVKIDGKIAAFAFGISWNIQTSVDQINTIDNYLPHELIPNRIDVTGTISGFRIPGSGPGSNLIQSDVLSFLRQNYIEIEVRDSQTDNIIFLTRKAMVTRRSENIRTGNLADLSLDFMAIGFLDERSSPKDPIARDVT